MKAQCKALAGKLTFEVTGESPKEVFGQIGDILEVFDAEHKCGMCQSPDLAPAHRVAQTYNFYELVCKGCGARFSFGQKKVGGALFPKRRDKEGRTLPNGGWSKYVAGADEDDEANYPPEPPEPPEPPAGPRPTGNRQAPPPPRRAAGR